MVELDGNEGTGDSGLSWDGNFVDKEGITVCVVVVVDVCLGSLDDRGSVGLLEGVFNIHINTQDTDEP